MNGETLSVKDSMTEVLHFRSRCSVGGNELLFVPHSLAPPIPQVIDPLPGDVSTQFPILCESNDASTVTVLLTPSEQIVLCHLQSYSLDTLCIVLSICNLMVWQLFLLLIPHSILSLTICMHID